jgi:hypothetical protein
MGRRKNGQYLFYIALVVIAILFFLGRFTIEPFQNTEKPKGVILELIGGLGNQLYIYSAGKVIEKALNTPIFLIPPKEDIKFKNVHSNTDYRKILFKDFTAIERNDKRLSDKIDARVEMAFWDPWKPEDIPSTSQYVYLPEQWYQYFPAIKDVISEVRTTVLNTFKSLYGENTLPSDSAFIHVRRGDYTRDGNEAYLLGMEYYNKALDILNKIEGIQSYYILSDDIEWCKTQKWNTNKPITYLDEPNEMKALYMMSQCKGGAIISNSTFSTWGAILGAYDAEGKIIYPSKWLYGASTAFPEDWIRI